MQRAQRVVPAGHWDRARWVATVTLDFDGRFRRRMVLRDDAGEPFLLDLERATRLADGDGLLLEEGGVVEVRAAEERVAEASAKDAAGLARLAWHLGNRHIPVEIRAGNAVRFREDPVVIALLRGLGAQVECRVAPFNPEAGAYSGAVLDHAD